MASKKIAMYAEKKYELEEIRNEIKAQFDKHVWFDVEFKDEILRELGEDALRTLGFVSKVC